MPIFRGKQFVSAVSDLKDSVKAVSTTNTNLAATVSSIDSATLENLDRVLLAGQTTASQNGIYVWNSATSLLTRATDADSGVELNSGARVYVEQGTQHGQTNWVLVTTGAIVVGTTALTFIEENRVGNYIFAGSYGAANSTIVLQLGLSGQINSITTTEINVDGGSF